RAGAGAGAGTGEYAGCGAQGPGDYAERGAQGPGAAPGRRRRWRRAGRWGLGLATFDITGVFFATLFLCWSLTPSLLPRGWLFQGLIGGINAALGYGVGLAVGWAARRFYLDKRSW